MQTLEYYNRSKEKWSDEESQQIKKEYEIDLLDVLEIAIKHKRTPGCIVHKLKNLDILTNHTMARGYDTYKSSTLYKEICLAYRKNDEEKINKKNQKYITNYLEDKNTDEENNSSNYPARMGKKWEDDEILKLLNSIQKKKTISDIATEHGRTIGGINSQRRRLAAEYWFNDKRPIEEISKFTGLTIDEIKDAIKRRTNEKKEVKMFSKQAITIPTSVELPPRRRLAFEIHEMRAEINELKKDIKQIIILMNAVYDFESQ